MSRRRTVLIAAVLAALTAMAAPAADGMSQQQLMEMMERRFRQMEKKLEATQEKLESTQSAQQATQAKLEAAETRLKTTESRLAEFETGKNVKSGPALAAGTAEKKPMPVVAAPTGTVQADENGFKITSSNGDYQLRFNALVQADQDIFMNTKGVTINTGVSAVADNDRNNDDRLWVRRARPIFSGTLFKYTDFYLQPDFGQGQVRLFDAYLDIHYLDWLGLTVGKQRSLLGGIEQLKSSATLFSMEQGYSTMMAPNREIGLMLHGEFSAPGQSHKYTNHISFNDWFAYQIGLFSGTADNTSPGLNPVTATNFSTETSTIGNKGVEARIFVHPFQGSGIAPLEGLGVGIAGGYDNPDNQTTLPAMVSVGQNPIFTYAQTIGANGTRTRIHPQAYWFWGPFGVLGDWTQTTQTLTSNLQPSGPGPVSQSITQNNQAGQIQLSYNLTGEKNGFGALKPDKSFDPFGSGGWGALQIVGRWSGLYMDSSVFNVAASAAGQTNYSFADPRVSVQQANTWSIGLNWLLNNNVKITTEYDQTNFVGGCSTGAMSAQYNPGCLTSGTAATAATSQVINRPDEKVIMQRFQLHF